MTDKPRVRSASYLSPPDLHRLDWACVPIRRAFGTPPYLVGSALTRPDFRDIDLRLILDNDEIRGLFGLATRYGGTTEQPGPNLRWQLIEIALSDLVAKAANLPWPIDFQIQSATKARSGYDDLPRNPMGVR